METMQMKEKIIEIIRNMKQDQEFESDTDLVEEGILDSFDIANLMIELELEFEIEISGLDIIPENFSTIDSMIRLIEKYRRAS
jgi:D-alanine--poly(phosphoribitol) ligase subunit 2